MKQDKIKLGVSYTDWRFDEYVNWLKSRPVEVEVVVLSYELGNTDDLLGCDALVITGGKDLNPALYGKSDESHLCGNLLPERDAFELKLIEIALNNKLPLLGICRGQQIVNIAPYFGGTLYCDIPSIKDIKALEHSNESPSGPRHLINIVDRTLMSDIMSSEQVEVNSFHHQSVERVGKGLRVSSYAPDGIIESLEWSDREHTPLLLLVQWHPERLVEEKSSKLLIDYFYNRITTKRN
jgi:putative glutamine amidotransferase